MFKSIAYAYPTSDVALSMGRASQGCYFIECAEEYTAAPAARHGPYPSLSDAEQAAESIKADWSPFTERAVKVGRDANGRTYLMLGDKPARSTVIGVCVEVEACDGSSRATFDLNAYNAMIAE